MRILAIDDTRELTEAHVLARNFKEGIRQLQINGPWDLLLLDHDLASFDSDGREKTGYDIMCFLEENLHLAPKKIECVSANPVGRSRIVAMIVRLNEQIKQTSGDGHDI
jgi:hypothetical protein